LISLNNQYAGIAVRFLVERWLRRDERTEESAFCIWDGFSAGRSAYNAGIENLSVWLVMTKYGEHLTRWRKIFRRSTISGRG
jgi:hypothetical protein